MRILHTSDWHLGASLEGVSRDADHAFILQWMAETIEREKVDVLVIAGDVFDQAHPPAEAQRLYYRFLRDVSARGLRKVVIVGGNHDSAARLDAPKEVLDSLSVHVVGGLLADDSTWERCLCPIPGANGGIDAVVLAVPFVHEYRLGVRTLLSSETEMLSAFRAAFRGFYEKVTDLAVSRYDGAPVIATGHLTCVGVEKGDCPADIHMVGTIGGLPADIFDPRLQYVALGHIHRSYRVGDSRAYYSGTPLALSLKEAQVARGVRLVDLAEPPTDAASVRTLEVPSPRDILELAGTPKEVAAALRELTWETELQPIVYAKVFVDRFTASVEDELRKAVLARGERAPILCAVRQEPLQVPLRIVQSSHGDGTMLRDLSPEEVFVRLCQERQVAADPELLNAFRSLLSEDEGQSSRGAQ